MAWQLCNARCTGCVLSTKAAVKLSDVIWASPPETPQIHQTVAFELIIGRCALDLRNLLLKLGFSVSYMTTYGAMAHSSRTWAVQHDSLVTWVIYRGDRYWFSFFLSFFLSLFWNRYCFTHLSSLCLGRHHSSFQDCLLHTEGASTEMAYRFSVYVTQ